MSLTERLRVGSSRLVQNLPPLPIPPPPHFSEFRVPFQQGEGAWRGEGPRSRSVRLRVYTYTHGCAYAYTRRAPPRPPQSPPPHYAPPPPTPPQKMIGADFLQRLWHRAIQANKLFQCQPKLRTTGGGKGRRRKDPARSHPPRDPPLKRCPPSVCCFFLSHQRALPYH